jgi:hypothetical protein
LIAALPFAFSCALAALALLAPIRENPRALAAFLGAAGALAVWNAALVMGARRAGRTLRLEVTLRKQHYLQACAQGSVLLYWGWYWPPVYAFAPFIVAQLAFAYAFDMLLAWSRRDDYTLGFAQFPVVFSINLFLWFKPDWIYLQFLMVAVGLAAKELIRWNKGGRRVHIFNPSSFPLAVFSLALLAAGKSGITWGQDIATTQFYPPQMYLMLFLIGLPGQFFFGVTSMTMSAVVTTWAFGRIYFAMTGIYFFYDSYIPIAVFLGMHLLFNDPSTSPRTEPGRIMFGVLYGLSAVGLYQLLGSAGMPTFYDKLLQVPVLNLSIKGIDGLARSRFLRRLDPAALGRALTLRMRNIAYMSVWGMVFAGLSVAQGVGDNHPGQWLPFWRRACEDGRSYACPYLADMEELFCKQGSGWACNEAGRKDVALARTGEDLRRQNPAKAAVPLRRGCELGFETACRNLDGLRSDALRSGAGELASAPPGIGDLPIILRGSKGEIRERDPEKLYGLGCKEGWAEMCGR